MAFLSTGDPSDREGADHMPSAATFVTCRWGISEISYHCFLLHSSRRGADALSNELLRASLSPSNDAVPPSEPQGASCFTNEPPVISRTRFYTLYPPMHKLRELHETETSRKVVLRVWRRQFLQWLLWQSKISAQASVAHFVDEANAVDCSSTPLGGVIRSGGLRFR